MYKSRVKQRKFKNFLKNIALLTKFKTTNFSKARKTTLVGVITLFLSLFLTWINSPLLAGSTGVFNSITGFTGLVLLFIALFITFTIFSTNKKEKLKLLTNTSFKDKNIIIYLSLIVMIMSINSLYNISGLITFSADVSYGGGVILSLISGIVLLVSGIMFKNELSTNENLVLNDSEIDEVKKDNKSNMKLPF